MRRESGAADTWLALLAVSAFLMSTVAAYLAFDAKRGLDELQNAFESDEQVLASVGDHATQAGEAVRAANVRIRQLDEAVLRLGEEVTALRARVGPLEEKAGRVEGPDAGAALGDVAYTELLDLVTGGGGTESDGTRLLDACRARGTLGNLVTRLKETVKTHPQVENLLVRAVIALKE